MKETRPKMSFNKDGKTRKPLAVFDINDSYVVGAYKGSLSKYDLLVKYRQKLKDDSWSRLRTPKHIHWAVDLLIKMHEDRVKTKQFLQFLEGMWIDTKPIKTKEEREHVLSLKHLIEEHKSEITKYKQLGRKGEYSIKFLILLAKLLMVQEKTNYPQAYMFKKLLEALESGEDIFKIVSTATLTGRR